MRPVTNLPINGSPFRFKGSSVVTAAAYILISTSLFLGIGFVVALLIHHFKFLKIVNQNLERIGMMNEKQCLFAFISWKSYLIIFIMVILGIVLRHSEIPRHYLAILYTGIGLALILSSVRYMRVYFLELKKHRKL